MSAFRRSRAWKGAIGIALAYVLAVQAVLLAFSATRIALAAPADAAAFCHGTEAGGDSNAPAMDHASCGACVLLSSSLPVPQFDATVWVAPPATKVQHFTACGAFGIARIHSPRTSQGPPAVA